MQLLRTAFVFGILTLLVVTHTGCVAVAVGAGAGAGIVYVRGASVIRVEGSPPEVAAATEQAFLQLGIAVISNTSNASCAHLIGRTSCDDKVDVDVDARACNLSVISIRVGVFGSRFLQNRILSHITENLRMRGTEQILPPPEEPPMAPPDEQLQPAEPPAAETRGEDG
jgi:hypothetical protein